MKLLAFDTSGEILSAALTENGHLICEEQSVSSERHSSALVPFLEKALKKARWRPDELDVLAVGVGPGSFTGIRVGVTTAMLLGLVWKTKLVGISSLEALARSSGVSSGLVPVAVDARRGRIYAALYEKKGGDFIERIAPMLTAPDEFFKRAGGPVPVLERPVVRASDVAAAALDKARHKIFKTPYTLEPLYLHPKDCNVTKKK